VAGLGIIENKAAAVSADPNIGRVHDTKCKQRRGSGIDGVTTCQMNIACGFTGPRRQPAIAWRMSPLLRYFE
jgi:hypothetical protein